MTRVESRQHWQEYTRGIMAHPPLSLVAQQRGGFSAYALEGYDAAYGSWNRCGLFCGHARNKVSMTVDLTKPKGKEIFKRLIKVSDIFLESNSPIVMEKLGLTYDVLKEVKPDLIMLSLSGFGQSGPCKYYRAAGVHQEGFTGHTYLRGYPDLDAVYTVIVNHTDEAAGATATFALVMGLYHRNRTGKGQFIDMA